MGNFIGTLADVVEGATLARSAIAVSSSIASGWTPSQWGGYSQDESQLIYLTPNINNGSTGYFFDAILRYAHNTSLTITEQPIQVGAAITDHSYEDPAHLVMDIGVSDSMSTLVSGQFTGASSKSISAYQTLVNLQYTRVPLTVVTRLQTYTNMLISNIEAIDDKTTTYCLKAAITFQQILMAIVGSQATPASNQAQSVSGLSSMSGTPTGCSGNNMNIQSGSLTSASPTTELGGGSGCPNCMNSQLGTATASNTWQMSDSSNIDAVSGYGN